MPQEYVVYRSLERIRVDGKSEEDSWKRVPWTNFFQDIEGPVKPLPRYTTRVKMVWDDTCLYVLAEMQEPQLWASIHKRDAVIFYDNDFEVFIDPDGDTYGYYEVEMNALNTVWDLYLTRPYRDGGRPITGWDLVGIRTAVSLHGTLNDPSDQDSGWTVEVAIPFHALPEYPGKSRPHNGDQWRMNFSRVEWKTIVVDGVYHKEKDSLTGRMFPEENWVWSPIGAVDMHRPECWGYIQFSDTVAGGKSISFVSDPDEEVKDELRKIYFAQRAYAARYKHFASSIEELNKGGLTNEILQYNPQLRSTFTLYECIATRPGSSWQWHIDQSGRLWHTVSK